MSVESLTVTDGRPGLISLVGRAVGLDASATARFAQRDDDHVDVFVTTPFDCVASRRIVGVASRDGAAVAASDLLNALQAEVARVGTARDPNWPGALPPREGFSERDVVPVTVVRHLGDEGRALARQFSGPLGPPASLLNQTVLTADADSDAPVEIPMRMIFTCTALGLIPGFAAPVEVPRHLRVSTSGRWVRVDAPFGTVYHSTSLGLFV
ncbi:hypothetical protein ACUY28_02305 [Corynebacterium sanguinis]|uniref:Uncharacterized protein n=1 Tax=Corynebacterium sanguinis TaxID=2594913 RepID=A0A838WZQ6_9CORY|nr:hypothetical protein [Corynebacterium sanguinis]MBA4506205.1 hypothetical protein [Corynebacterium sanguinis]MCT1583917.1 hypothetical protein [Corynebacterium sanguinis]MCT1663276.1 hypothetical protein [Corynebacterium sanguinis]MCT2046377.1 hypothetical protein [Corynebacterium sanguinis]MDN8577403.1 hypothetical protein [Corynebacterium sanguinis]